MRKLFLLSCLWMTHFLAGFEGFYAGAAGGVSATLGKQRGAALGAAFDIVNYPLDLNTTLLHSTAAGMFYAGYGLKCNYFFGGIEAFAQYSNDRIGANRRNINSFPEAIVTYLTSDQTQLFAGPWHYGIDLRPGFLLSEQTLLYGRIGFSYSRVRLQTDVSNETILLVPLEPPAILFSDTLSRFRPFLRWGLGIEQWLSNCFTLRADYIYTDYRNFSSAFSMSSADLTLTGSKRLAFHNHTLLLGVCYHFNSPFVCEMNCSDRNFSGCYISANAGGTLTDCRLQAEILNVSPGPGNVVFFEGFHPIEIPTQIGNENFRGSTLVGYGLQCKRLYAGLEAFVQYAPFSKRNEYNQIFLDPDTLFNALNRVITTAKVDSLQVGLEARPGFVLTPKTLLYGTIGGAYAKIRGSSEAFFNNAEGLTLFVPLSKHASRVAIIAGGGVEYAFCSRWHLRADYKCTNFGSLSMRGFASISDPFAGLVSLSDATKIRLVNHALTLGLCWYL